MMTKEEAPGDMLDAASHLGLGGGRHQNARAWHDYHARQLVALEGTFAALTTRHRSERARFAAMLGINVPGAQPMDGADGPPPGAA